jgi:hypothetical protein
MPLHWQVRLLWVQAVRTLKMIVPMMNDTSGRLGSMLIDGNPGQVLPG